MNVFVHLDFGFGLSSWNQRWRQGLIIGINHEDPYGYRQAVDMGCVLQHSQDRLETRLEWFIRRSLRKMLGFDLLHAWRNRQGIYRAQVVWTDTEFESLPVLLLLQFRKGARPKVFAESIWLMDRWDDLPWIRRLMYAHLLRQADLLTFHSRMGVEKARAAFPEKRSELVRFGIRVGGQPEYRDRATHTPVRVLSVGNDRHRDWTTLIKSVGNDRCCKAKLVTRKNLSKMLLGLTNVTQEQPHTNEGLLELYRWADVVVVCLKENLHASGTTVIQEAVLCGIPVICSDTGGLRDYFSAEEVTYVPPGNPAAVRSAIHKLNSDPPPFRRKAERAITKMKQGDINSRTFVAKHVELSRELLFGESPNSVEPARDPFPEFAYPMSD